MNYIIRTVTIYFLGFVAAVLAIQAIPEGSTFLNIGMGAVTMYIALLVGSKFN